jgi:hypothetical protein
LQNLPPDEGPAKSQRPEREILEEVLALVRSQAREAAQSSAGNGYGPEVLEQRIRDAVQFAAKDLEIAILGCSILHTPRAFLVTIKTDTGEHKFPLPPDPVGMGTLVKRIRRRISAAQQPILPSES